MAGGKKERSPAAMPELPAEPVKKRNRLIQMMRLVGFLLVFLCLIAGGLFLGAYFRLFDTNAVSEKLGLYDYPVIGQYFERPAETDDEVDPSQPETDAGQTADVVSEKANDPAKLSDGERANLLAAGNSEKKIVLNKEEIEQQMKQRQEEEKKRVAKLARLYGEMKPGEAVEILNELDDDMVLEIMSKMNDDQVAELLPLFDTTRSARLTRLMYTGKPPVAQIR